MPFDQFFKVSRKLESRINGGRKPFLNHEWNSTIGKVTLPSFYGSSQMSSSSWIQKLDVYFQLNPMVQEYALKMAILHI